MHYLEYPADTTPPSRHPAPNSDSAQAGEPEVVIDEEIDIWKLKPMYTGLDERWKSSLRVEVKARLASSHGKEVLRVEVAAVPFDGRWMPLVCKTGYGKQYADLVKNEATVYHTKLDGLQGNIVPKLYGCYVGLTYQGPTAVMLLEDCGDPLPRSLRLCPVDVQYQIVAGLISIHRAGVRHDDFTDRNFVIKKLASEGRDGELWPMIVDFGDAQVHDCAFMDEITMYAPKPPESQINCEELYTTCSWAQMWVPSTMLFLGWRVPVEIVTMPEELAKKGTNPLDRQFLDEETILRSAKATIQELREWYEERKRWDSIPLIIP